MENTFEETPEECQVSMEEAVKAMKEFDNHIKELKEEARKELADLLNVDLLFKALDNDLSFWKPEGIVEVTPFKKEIYPKRNFGKVDGMSEVFEKQDEDIEDIGVDHIYIWQTVGCCEDDYSGWELYPLKNGKYWRIYYEC